MDSQEEKLLAELESVQRDVRINKYKLDEECARQSTLYLYYSDLLAEAKDSEDEADDALDKVLGVVEMKLRDSPPEGVKVTDSTIKALVAKDDEVDKAKEKLRKAKKWKYRIEGIVNSMGHKKSGLDNLVVLWSRGYYMSDAGTPRTGADEASERLRGNLNNRKEGEEKK
ncbi:MAG: hypothetical protein C4K49_10760 [Candidatus Thorarchaeota archaeon]|nr:MAG: hypothetical protein C4K49_10760 [Candidatus Thorarchaeota archaeon]